MQKDIDKIEAIPNVLVSDQIEQLVLRNTNRGRPGITYDFLATVYAESKMIKKIAKDWKKAYASVAENRDVTRQQLNEAITERDSLSEQVFQLTQEIEGLKSLNKILQERANLVFTDTDVAELETVFNRLTTDSE